MTSKRLLFVLYELAFGGVERQAQLLAEAAHALGHRVSLLVLGTDGPAFARFAACCDRITILNAPISNDFALHRTIRLGIANHQYDAAILFSTAKLPVISHALKERVPVQLVHVGNPAERILTEQLKHQLRSIFFPPSAQLQLVANSQYTLNTLLEHPFYRQFPAAMSWNSTHLPEHPVEIREICEPLRIGMVARLDRIKDQSTLIKAVAEARKLAPGTKVVCELVGGGELESSLKAEAEQLKLDSSVIFAGWVDNVPERLRSWDLFVFSTTAREGFGNAAAEAMGIGLPCIFTDVGPCREVGADAVEYVPPVNALALAQAILGMAEAGKRRSFAARSRARAMEWFRPERNFLDYFRLLSTGSPDQ